MKSPGLSKSTGQIASPRPKGGIGGGGGIQVLVQNSPRNKSSPLTPRRSGGSPRPHKSASPRGKSPKNEGEHTLVKELDRWTLVISRAIECGQLQCYLVTLNPGYYTWNGFEYILNEDCPFVSNSLIDAWKEKNRVNFIVDRAKNGIAYLSASWFPPHPLDIQHYSEIERPSTINKDDLDAYNKTRKAALAAGQLEFFLRVCFEGIDYVKDTTDPLNIRYVLLKPSLQRVIEWASGKHIEIQVRVPGNLLLADRSTCSAVPCNFGYLIAKKLFLFQ